VKLDFSLFLSILWHVNTSVRIILGILISLTFTVGVFADSEKDTGSGKTQSWSTTETSEAIKDTENQEDEKKEKEEITEAKKEKIKQEISSYIIESYKLQGDKILKDIDQTLQKTAPEKEDRIEAYKKIRASLDARRLKNMRSIKTSDTSKTIVNEFLTHMIVSIDKKIEELSK
jgi:hypothetical protein